MNVYTIKGLKDVIKNLPDDMEVKGYKNGKEEMCIINTSLLSNKTITDEEINDNDKPILVICID
ncbi:hypothetical protein M0Q50_02320 [bacterium]|jgi:hypothetical protein|nr:hypothetical protein [bacterium]